MIFAAAIALIFETLRIRSHGSMWLAPVAVGLGAVLPPDSTIAIFIGAFLFTTLKYKYQKTDAKTLVHKLWIETAEPICAGMIAVFALMGTGDVLIRVFVFGR